MPLILTYGWSGSVLEFEAVVGPLTDPPAYGGAAADAFSLVLPSLPGYGFSGRPTGSGWGIGRIADAWAGLMSRLGYARFGASGGYWGSSISTCLGQQHPERITGLHLTPPLAAPDPATFGDLTPAEQESLAALRRADVPLGGSVFAHENPRPSRRWAQKRFVDIEYGNELDRASHFAA